MYTCRNQKQSRSLSYFPSIYSVSSQNPSSTPCKLEILCGQTDELIPFEHFLRRTSVARKRIGCLGFRSHATVSGVVHDSSFQSKTSQLHSRYKEGRSKALLAGTVSQRCSMRYSTAARKKSRSRPKERGAKQSASSSICVAEILDAHSPAAPKKVP